MAAQNFDNLKNFFRFNTNVTVCSSISLSFTFVAQKSRKIYQIQILVYKILVCISCILKSAIWRQPLRIEAGILDI